MRIFEGIPYTSLPNCQCDSSGSNTERYPPSHSYPHGIEGWRLSAPAQRCITGNSGVSDKRRSLRLPCPVGAVLAAGGRRVALDRSGASVGRYGLLAEQTQTQR
jgi:hypothetical protein